MKFNDSSASSVSSGQARGAATFSLRYEVTTIQSMFCLGNCNIAHSLSKDGKEKTLQIKLFKEV